MPRLFPALSSLPPRRLFPALPLVALIGALSSPAPAETVPDDQPDTLLAGGAAAAAPATTAAPPSAPSPTPPAAKPAADKSEDHDAESLRDPDIPEPVRAMLAEAMANGDTAELATIVKYAVKTNPRAATAIQGIVDAYSNQKEAMRRQTIQQAGAFSLWDGKVELGGYSSSGTSSTSGISSSLAVTRKGLRWTHAVNASVDYRRANGSTSTEHLLASYAPRYTLNGNNFVYGLLQYERDPVVGFDNRFAGSFGIGYALIDNPNLSLQASLGPSLRHTDYTEDGQETKLGARSSLDVKWRLNPALSIKQTTSAYGESRIASITSLTALDARVITKLTARLSYNLQYETDTRLSDRVFNTTSKVTFIYDF